MNHRLISNLQRFSRFLFRLNYRYDTVQRLRHRDELLSRHQSMKIVFSFSPSSKVRCPRIILDSSKLINKRINKKGKRRRARRFHALDLSETLTWYFRRMYLILFHFILSGFLCYKVFRN